MQSVFVIITKLIASKNYFCKEVFCNNFGRDGIFIFLKSSKSTLLGGAKHGSIWQNCVSNPVLNGFLTL